MPFARTLTLEELVMRSAEDEQDPGGGVKEVEEEKEEVEREGLRGGARVSENVGSGGGLGSSAQGAGMEAGSEAEGITYVYEGEIMFDVSRLQSW